MREFQWLKRLMYAGLQCTWGLCQTLMGFCLFAVHIRDRHYFYHGAVVTEWTNSSSVSLGLFVFVAREPYPAEQKRENLKSSDMASRLLVHEYGHTLQSLILGPMYLLIIGIPSLAWANLPALSAKRRRENISYFSFFTERWANRLGEWATREKSMGQMMID